MDNKKSCLSGNRTHLAHFSGQMHNQYVMLLLRCIVYLPIGLTIPRYLRQDSVCLLHCQLKAFPCRLRVGLGWIAGMNGPVHHTRQPQTVTLDIRTLDFWGVRSQRAYFDVKVFNPLVKTYRDKSLSTAI